MGAVGRDANELSEDFAVMTNANLHYDHRNNVELDVTQMRDNRAGEDDEFSNEATAVASLSSSERSMIGTSAAPFMPRKEPVVIDPPTVILESRLLAHLAEQTSREMQQVVEWWMDQKVNQDDMLDQEVALPNNVLAHSTDWCVMTATPTTTEASIEETIDFASIWSLSAKSREEALEQSYLVDLVEERTRAMEDFVRRFPRMLDAIERSRQDRADYNDAVYTASRIFGQSSHSAKSSIRFFDVISTFIGLLLLILPYLLQESPAQSLSTKRQSPDPPSPHATCPVESHHHVFLSNVTKY